MTIGRFTEGTRSSLASEFHGYLWPVPTRTTSMMHYLYTVGCIAYIVIIEVTHYRWESTRRRCCRNFLETSQPPDIADRDNFYSNFRPRFHRIYPFFCVSRIVPPRRSNKFDRFVDPDWIWLHCEIVFGPFFFSFFFFFFFFFSTLDDYGNMWKLVKNIHICIYELRTYLNEWWFKVIIDRMK